MTDQQASDRSRQWGQIVARAWGDEGFKKRLLADPEPVLRESGVAMRPGQQVQVLEDTEHVLHLTLPQKPNSEELPEAALERVAAGAIFMNQTFLKIE
jgi:hypothetical protein